MELTRYYDSLPKFSASLLTVMLFFALACVIQLCNLCSISFAKYKSTGLLEYNLSS